MTNRLARETSPYLLQHAENPVDWYAWGDEALAIAREQDKPIFLSIGYSACHWCHVMEHESFENKQIAEFLNEHFVSIKVDREERPDLDQIYMNAVMALRQGQGGWPLSAFLTPQQEVFFGGTYWPPTARMGMQGFDQVLHGVLDAYVNRREQVDQQSKHITDWLNQSQKLDQSSELSHQMLFDAATMLQRNFDSRNGGFGSAPKFPHPMDLSLLLRLARRWPEHVAPGTVAMIDMVRLSLTKMAYGGIFDHLAGGFARYSVDEYWLVPHFEKMLYDNALLAGVYLDMFVDSDEEFFARIARKTLGYLLAYMTDDAGCFHSTEDADSEGVEGKFYVWSRQEIIELLGDETGRRFCDLYDVTEHGNFEGANILNLRKTFQQFADLHGLEKDALRDEIRQARVKLLAVRDKRVRPGKDDKVLVSWNALAISSMARAAVLLGENKYGQAAKKAADFILREMRHDSGRLLHTWRNGHAKLAAFLDDYSCFAVALLDLYEVDFDQKRIQQAADLVRQMIDHFANPEGGFYYTADDQEQLISRPTSFQDSSVPSGNAMAAIALLRLGRITGNSDWIGLARQTISTAASLLKKSPLASGQMLIALEQLLTGGIEMVVVGDDDQSVAESVEAIRKANLANVSLIRKMPDSEPISELKSVLDDKETIDGETTLYVCRDFSCDQPIVGLTAISTAIKRLSETVDRYPVPA